MLRVPLDLGHGRCPPGHGGAAAGRRTAAGLRWQALRPCWARYHFFLRGCRPHAALGGVAIAKAAILR
eukprot:9606281-Lingulodinium_polyedra.AAC.1